MEKILLIGTTEDYAESQQKKGYNVTYYPSIKLAYDYFYKNPEELNTYAIIQLENLPTILYGRGKKERPETKKEAVYSAIYRTGKSNAIETTKDIQAEGFKFRGYTHIEKKPQPAELPTDERISILFTEYYEVSEGTRKIAPRIGLPSMQFEKGNNYTLSDKIMENFTPNIIIAYDGETDDNIEATDKIPEMLRMPLEWVAQLSAANQTSGIIATYKTTRKERNPETKTEYYTNKITINYRLAINGMVSGVNTLQFDILATKDEGKKISYIDTTFEAIMNAIVETYLDATKIPRIGLKTKSVEDYTKELNAAQERDKKTIYTLKLLRQGIKAHLNQPTKSPLNNLSIIEDESDDEPKYVIKVQDEKGKQYTIILPNKQKVDSITIQKDSGESKTVTTNPYDKDSNILTPKDFELLESIIKQLKSKSPKSVEDTAKTLFEQTEQYLQSLATNPDVIENLRVEKANCCESPQYYITKKDDHISYRIMLTPDSIKVLKRRSIVESEDLTIENEDDIGRLIINDVIETLEERNGIYNVSEEYIQNIIGEESIKETLSPPSSIKISVEEAQTSTYTIYSQAITLLSRGRENTYPLNNSMGEISINNHNIDITLRDYTKVKNVMIPTTYHITLEIDNNIVAHSLTIKTTASSVQLSKTIPLDSKRTTCENLTTSDLALLEKVSKIINESSPQTDNNKSHIRGRKQLIYKMEDFYKDPNKYKNYN